MAYLFDFSYLGGVDLDGNLPQLTDADALKNALTMWLFSYPTDTLGSLGRGGRVVPFIGKPMTDQNQQFLYQTIQEGIEEDFKELQIIALRVIADFEFTAWTIEIDVYSAPLKQRVQLTAQVRAS